MQKLLQEIYDFEKYKDCLNFETIKIYEKGLKKRLKVRLNELTVKGLAKSFKIVFKKNIIDTSDATLEKISTAAKAQQHSMYHSKNDKIIPDGRTNLEITTNNFCTKSKFTKEFKKEDFSEFKTKEDVSVESAVNTFLEKYLEVFDENGWLISDVDDYEKVKDVEILNLIY